MVIVGVVKGGQVNGGPHPPLRQGVRKVGCSVAVASNAIRLTPSDGVIDRDFHVLTGGPGTLLVHPRTSLGRHRYDARLDRERCAERQLDGADRRCHGSAAAVRQVI